MGSCKCWCVFVICLASVFGCVYGSPRSEEVTALENFLHAVLPSSSFTSFNFSAICSWEKIRCTEDGIVTGIFLESLDLRGYIPMNTLGNLSSLSELSLYNNSLQSPIPPDIWSLTNLRYLSLSLNSFEEELSTQLSHLVKLERLDLSQNKFYGPIPQQIGQLNHLQYLYLGFNSFSGSLSADVFTNPSLRVLDISHNELNGSLPPQPTNLSNLLYLNLSGNSISGKLPFGLSAMRTLATLDLSNNSFTGDLESLHGLPSLEQVILSFNSFTGPIPLLRSSKIVKMNSNLLSGHIQAVFGPQLSVLDLSSNSLSGAISELVNVSSPLMKHIDVSSNSFSGSLSLVNFTSFTALEYLDLSSNNITGSIPDAIGDSTNLTYIDFSNNMINGSVPQSFVHLTSLSHLDLSCNSLSGDVTELTRLQNMKYLNLSFNENLGCNFALVAAFGMGSFSGVMDCRPAAANITLPPPGSLRKGKINLGIVVGVVVGCVLGLGVVFMIFSVVRCRKKGRWPRHSTLSLKQRVGTFKEDSKFMSGPFSFESNSGPWVANVKNATSVPVIMFEKPLLNLTFADLLRATSNFNRETQVSQGGLGPVYSAMLPGDLHVSIKVLIDGRILTNEVAASEFSSLAKIKHPNLVPLLGYCIVGEERLVIYEFMKNGGLHRWLLGSPDCSQGFPPHNHMYYDVSRDLASRATVEPLPEAVNLSWGVRHKIALGLARALAFLHHGQSVKLVHRDVKASNVMLDEEFEPHLANTGLAGLLAGSEDAMFAGGSPGYAPPEYGQSGGKVTSMGDVFSYGVVLLELVTGKKPIGDTYEDEEGAGTSGCPAINDLVGWIRMLMHEKQSGSLIRALDSRAYEDPISQGQMLEVLRIGYLCTADLASKRPTIQQVVGLLKDIAPNMNSP